MEKTLFPNLISPKITRTTGKDAWRQNLQMAVFAANKIRSSLGPMGAYKLVTYNRGPEKIVKITKDPVAILDELAIEYPPTIIISESAKMQRAEAGDGVASFAVFVSALLKKADELSNLQVHPNIIIHGYNLAANKALEIIDQQATSPSSQSDVLDVVDCKRNLLTPQFRSMIREAYGLASVSGKFDRDYVRFLKRNGGSIQESKLIRGVVVKKEKAHPNMPSSLRNLRIAVATQRPGINRLELKMKGEGATPMRLSIKNAEQMRKYRETEEKLKSESLNKLLELKANVLLCEQPIDDALKDKLVSHGIFALESVDQKDTQAIQKATGAKSVGKLSDLTEEDLGHAEDLSTGTLELEKTATIQGCKGATFLLRGSAPQALDELEVAIQNSLVVLKNMDEDNRVLPGGAAVEAHIAAELKRYSKQFANREQVAVEAFADALMDVPRCLAENYGLNATDLLLELKNAHADGHDGYGVCEEGCKETVCLEPAKAKSSMIRRACEVASLMLRVDELLISKEIAKFHKQ